MRLFLFGDDIYHQCQCKNITMPISETISTDESKGCIDQIKFIQLR